MNTTLTGLLTGLALGFAGYFGGFGALVVVAVLGAAGLIAGYLVRRDGYVAGFLHGRGGGSDDRRFRGRDSDRPRNRYEPRRAEGEPRSRAPFRERVQ